MRLTGLSTLAALAGLALLAAACSPKAPDAKMPDAAAPAPAATVSTAGDPVAVILPLYQPYLKGDQTPPPDWRIAIPFTAATHALIDKEAAANARTGEVGAIDGDPIVAAQDWKISNLEVALKAPPANSKAVVEAKFHNLDRDTVVSWDMVEEAGAWHVANIREPEVDLVKLMSEATAPAH